MTSVTPMRSAATGPLALFGIGWRHSPTKLITALVLTLAGGAAWPLLAFALRSATVAAAGHETAAGELAGALVGVGAVAALIVQHFAYFPYTEIAESAVITLEAQLMALANGSPGLEHHEQPEYADRLAVLREELTQLPDGFVGLFSTISLIVSMGVTEFLLVGVEPWLVLLPLSALPPVYAGWRAQRIVDAAKDVAAAPTRQAAHLFRLATSAAPAKELRVFGLQEEFADRYRRRWDEAGGCFVVVSGGRRLCTRPGRRCSP